MKLQTVLLAVAGTSVVAGSWAAWTIWGRGDGAEASNAYGRDRVEVCIEVDPAVKDDAAATQAEDAIRGGLADLRGGPYWKKWLQGYEYDTVLGCPGGYVEPPANPLNSSQQVGSGQPVDVASRFSTMVYVVGPDRADAFLQRGYGRMAREMMCESAQCGEVTTALFLTQDVLSNPPRLARALRDGLGLPDEPEDAEFPEGHPTDHEYFPKEPGASP